MKNKQTAGFTLIEIMIVVCIIGILAAIAYPSYTSSVQKSRRADAKGALMSFAGAMERNFTATNTYLGAATGGADTGTPTIFSTKSPIDGGETYYNLTISAATATSFTLSATPANQQANDSCGTLTLTNTGVRGVSKSTVAECW